MALIINTRNLTTKATEIQQRLASRIVYQLLFCNDPIVNVINVQSLLILDKTIRCNTFSIESIKSYELYDTCKHILDALTQFNFIFIIGRLENIRKDSTLYASYLKQFSVEQRAVINGTSKIIGFRRYFRLRGSMHEHGIFSAIKKFPLVVAKRKSLS